MRSTRVLTIALIVLSLAAGLAFAAAPPAAKEAPALTPAAAAAGVVPGDVAPSFSLKDTNGVEHTLAQYLADGKIVVLEWFNPDCPFIVKHHQLNRTMTETFMALQHKGMVWLAINSGAPGKQGAGLERNKKAHADYEMPFPILLDESGTVGRAYGAKTTPHMFVIGKDGKVAYSGAIDNDPSPTKPGERNYIISALRALMDGRAVPEPTTKPYGCSVKYGDK
jgi:peroxiredoxin